MASQAEIRAVENLMPQEILTAYTDNESAQTDSTGLNWWDRLKESIVPESHGESIVNAIYSSPSSTLMRDPVYDRNDLSSPNVYVQAKGVVKDFASAAFGFGSKIFIVIAVFALIAIAVYAFAGSYARRI